MPRERGAAPGLRRALIVAALLGIHYVLAVTSVLNKCITYDELAHLTRGVSYSLTGDYRLGPPHPPLAHYWAATPVLAMNPRFPSLNQPAWKRSDVWNIGRQLLYDTRLGNDPDAMLWRGRAMMVVLSAGLGLLVYFWSSRLFGPAGGLFSLTLYAFSPTMLAHAPLVTTDLVSAVFLTFSIFALWRLSHRVSIGTLLVAAIAVGCLFLSKGSAVLMATMGVLIIAVRQFSPRPLVWAIGRPREIHNRLHRLGILSGAAVLLVFTTALALWAGYGFRWAPFKNGASDPAGYERAAIAREYDYYSAAPPKPGMSAWEWQSRGLGASAAFCRWLHNSRLLPDAYVYGFLSMLQSARGRDAFLMGQRSMYGFHSFFPVAFAAKTPTPLLAILLTAALAALWPHLARRRADGSDSSGSTLTSAAGGEAAGSLLQSLYRAAPLLILVGVYALVSVRSTLNIGHRHLLPMEPALYILCGAAAALWHSSRKWLRWTPVALAAAFVGASLSAFPNYLAYFNQLVGGPRNGYQYLVDSSLDWGQDLPGLAAYLKEKGLAAGGDKPVYLSYFGNGNPRHAGITQYQPAVPSLASDVREDTRLTGGVYCISATHFQQVYMLDQGDLLAFGLWDGKGPIPPLPCRWSAELERIYQGLLPTMREFELLPPDAGTRIEFLKKWRPDDYRDWFYRFAKLRFMRLCDHLRERTPDAMPGYSILVFDLTDADVQKYVYGPPPERK